MHPVLRTALATFVGLIVAYLVIAVGQALNSVWFPLPADLDLTDAEAVGAAIADLPFGAFVGLIGSYVVGSLAGGAVAALMTRQRTASVLVGAGLTLTGFVNLASIPHPLWVAVVSSLVYLPSAWLPTRWLVPDPRPGGTR